MLALVAEPLRWRILTLLADEELTVSHLAEELGVAQPLVSHHLGALRRAGLVDTERYHYWTYYRLRPGGIDGLARTLTRMARSAWPPGPPRRPVRSRTGGPLMPDDPRPVPLPPFLRTVVQDLCRELSGVLGPGTVERLVAESHDALQAQARFPDFLPVLTERFARQRLRALAQAEGRIVKDVPEVLFVCVHNAGRSQMAAALLDHHAQGRVHVRSAGSTPADEIHAGVRGAMEEMGIDLSREFPKPLTDEVVSAADVVVTMGCGDACPIYPGKRYMDWELEDPAGKPVDEVRAIRDDVDRRVRTLLEELTPTSA